MASHLERQVGVGEAQLDREKGTLLIQTKTQETLPLSRILEYLKPVGFFPLKQIHLRAPGQIASRLGKPVFQVAGTGEAFFMASKELLKGVSTAPKSGNPVIFQVELVPKGASWIVNRLEIEGEEQPEP
ncbi:MAG: hypothetical protein HY652_05010 [Acidobacteria bacterium]|nr:hypothetical protein [Acidobacteriota bacterium]